MSGYLIHFNKNHDKLGKFTFGDGDGDGTRDDHAYSRDDVKNRIKERGKEAGLTDNQIKKATDKYLKDREKIGSNKTVEKYDNLMIDTEQTEKRMLKQLKEYNKSALEDIKEARRLGDEKSVNIINAGRMYTNALMSNEYINKVFHEAFNEYIKDNTVDMGKEFTYNMVQDDDFGGLIVTFNQAPDKKYYVKD